MSKPRICIYAICKDEEKNITNWLEHVKDADVIVVLDTGSTDKSIDLFKDALNTPSFKNKLHIQTKIWKKKFSFSEARNDSLNIARNIILNLKKDDEEDIPTIYITLDFDEFIEDNGINIIRDKWVEGYDVMLMKGITGKSYQYVEHKIHSDNPEWRWIRSVHEIIALGDKKQKDWKKLNSEVSYMHIQDINKDRNYYEMLKEDHILHPTDIKTNIYLAWESYNHEEYEDYYKYSKDCIKLILNNKNDEYYMDYEYLLQCYFNCYTYNSIIKDYEKGLEFLNRALAVINSGKFAKIRKLYFLLGECKWALANTYQFKEDINKARLESMLCYENCLKIKLRPYCWVDDDAYYDDAYIYSTISIGYYYLGRNKNDYLKALSYIELALSLNPSNDMYQMNRKICLNKVNSLFNSNTVLEENENMEIETNKIKENKICVYAICKNESQFVEKWYNSMKEADYIVVLDTGSTDDTVKKLQVCDNVIVKTEVINPWRFDVARNKSLELVPEDANILVCTDLDEVLEPGWADVLRSKWIEGVHERAVYKYSWSHLENGESGRIFQYDKVHSRKWIWKYPVHELLWNTETDTNLYSNENVLYIFDQMHLHHYPDRTKSRSSYLPLLELREKENDNDYYGLIYLSHEYFYQCQYENSIKTLNKVLLKHRDECTSVEEASCYLFMGDDYVAMKNYPKAIDSYLKAIEIDDSYREPYLNLAKVYLTKEMYEVAIAYVKMALKKSYRHFTWVERDLSWTYEPYDILCQACFYGGYKKDSIVYAAKALSYESDNRRLIDNLKLCIELTEDNEIL